MSKFQGKPQIKVEDGKVILGGVGSYDGNEDGKASLEMDVAMKIDAAELILELAKVDLPWLNSLVASAAAALPKG